MTANEVTEAMSVHDWQSRTNTFGLWIVGPMDECGIMNVVGMGRTFPEALEMALRSKGHHD